MNFTISIFNNKSDNLPQQVVRSWPQLCQRFASPVVRQEKDGPLFSPALFRPVKRRAANVVELSMLVLDCDHQVPSLKFLVSSLKSELGAWKLKLGAAFGIYSTHSHLQVTDSNKLAEPRFRVVVPLASPIPAAEFPALWKWAASIEGLHIDPSAKDVSRIYYTPAKFADEAPYEYHVESGAFFEWRGVVGQGEGVSSSSVQSPKSKVQNSEGVDGSVTQNSSGVAHNLSGVGDVGDRFGRGKAEDRLETQNSKLETFESRHEELTNRVMARGQRNARGVWDARCLAHNGKGNTGLLYNPATNAVGCNAGCTYDQILQAEGLVPGRLQSVSSPKSQVPGSAPAKLETSNLKPETFSLPSAAKLHVIYSLLLAHCLELKEVDQAMVEKHWGMDAVYGKEPIAWPVDTQHSALRTQQCFDLTTEREGEIVGEAGGFLKVRWAGHDHHNFIKPDQVRLIDGTKATCNEALVKVCSLPSFQAGEEAAERLSKLFDLEGVAGFFSYLAPGTRHPVPALNVPHLPAGALLSPFYSRGGYLVGIRIHRSWRDSGARPWLLSSRGLPGGAKAVAIEQAA